MLRGTCRFFRGSRPESTALRACTTKRDTPWLARLVWRYCLSRAKGGRREGDQQGGAVVGQAVLDRRLPLDARALAHGAHEGGELMVRPLVVHVAGEIPRGVQDARAALHGDRHARAPPARHRVAEPRHALRVLHQRRAEARRADLWVAIITLSSATRLMRPRLS